MAQPYETIALISTHQKSASSLFHNEGVDQDISIKQNQKISVQRI